MQSTFNFIIINPFVFLNLYLHENPFLKTQKTFNFINFQFYQLVMWSTCNFINLSCDQLAILPTCYFPLLSISSNFNFMNLSCHQLAISLTCNYINMKFHQFAMSWDCKFDEMTSFWHDKLMNRQLMKWLVDKVTKWRKTSQ